MEQRTPDRPPRVGPFGFAVVAGWVVLLAQCAWTWPFIADDALISLRYSRRLLDGAGLTFTDGEWVEGYSNLLVVLLAAGLGALGMDLITAARVVGLIGAAAAIGAVSAYGARRGLGPAMGGSVLLAASPGLGAWVVGGLEQALLAGLIAGALVLALVGDEEPDRRAWSWGAGLLFALACWTRPDTPVFVGVAAAWALWRGWRTAVALALPSVVAVTAQLGFRLSYYGDVLPNPAYAKLALTWHRMETGLDYVWDGTWPMAVLLGLAVLGSSRAPSRVNALLLPMVQIWIIYLVFIGGDIFPARRHLVVLLPILALLAGHGFHRNAIGGALAALLAAGLHGRVQEAGDVSYLHARAERWEWQCATIAAEMGAVFARYDPLLATNAAGCWPYFSGLDSLDMLGLNDAHIAKHPTPIRGHSGLGHELGDGAYVLSREPDFVLFGPWHGSEAPQYFGEVQLAALPGFKQGYRPVRFRAGGESALVWVRVRSKRIGLTMGSGEVVAPAWLFGRPGPAVVTELSGGRARTRMAKGSRSGLWVPVSTGTWRVELRAQGPAVIELLGGLAIDERTVSVSQPTTLKVVVRARGGVVWLDSVRLVRLR